MPQRHGDTEKRKTKGLTTEGTEDCGVHRESSGKRRERRGTKSRSLTPIRKQRGWVRDDN